MVSVATVSLLSSVSQRSLGDKRAVSYKGGFGERTLVPVFVPGEHPPKPPFWKPPFCQHQKGSLGDKRAVSKRVVLANVPSGTWAWHPVQTPFVMLPSQTLGAVGEVRRDKV